MMFLLGGAVLLWSLARLTATGRRISDAIDQTALMGFQTFRIMGGVFILGWLVGEIPWQFALPAGLGDIWAGIAGYRAMNAVNRGAADAETKILWANVIGLADFVVAVLAGLITLKVSCISSPKTGRTFINAYPLGLFPAFIVPLFIAFHLVSLGKLRQARRRAALA